MGAMRTSRGSFLGLHGVSKDRSSRKWMLRLSHCCRESAGDGNGVLLNGGNEDEQRLLSGSAWRQQRQEQLQVDVETDI